jgi:hypothetical protein
LMPPHPARPGQLDIPLVWEAGTSRAKGGGFEGASPQPPPAVGRVGAWRLWLAVLADAGVIVLAVTGVWGVAAVLVGTLGRAQFMLSAAVGLEMATVLALGCLWGWRASPGMLLAGVCFTRPIPFGQTVRLWLYWLASLLVLGLPLVLRHRGVSLAERLAGGTLSLRSLPEDA